MLLCRAGWEPYPSQRHQQGSRCSPASGTEGSTCSGIRRGLQVKTGTAEAAGSCRLAKHTPAAVWGCWSPGGCLDPSRGPGWLQKWPAEDVTPSQCLHCASIICPCRCLALMSCFRAPECSMFGLPKGNCLQATITHRGSQEPQGQDRQSLHHARGNVTSPELAIGRITAPSSWS